MSFPSDWISFLVQTSGNITLTSHNCQAAQPTLWGIGEHETGWQTLSQFSAYLYAPHPSLEINHMDSKEYAGKGQRFLQRKTADAENPVYENANVSRETLEFIQSCLWGWLCWWIVNSWLAESKHEGVRLGIECYFSVFNKFLSCHWNGFTWNMVGLVGSQVGCLRVLFLLYELPGIRVGLFIACFT